MKIDRKKLLQELKTVSGGLSKNEVIEQSDCFAFKGGEVMTFNDEIACRVKTCLDIEGVVHGAELLGILNKMKEEEIEITLDENKMTIKGKGKRATLKLEKEINLPIEEIEKPEDWKKVPSDFITALNLVKECTSNNSNSPHLMCIHIAPKLIEATDGQQGARYDIETSIDKDALIKKSSIQNVIANNMTKISETKSWLHFKNSEGLVLSCHKYIEDYPSDKLSVVLNKEGENIELPKNLKDTIERLSIFLDSGSSQETTLIDIKLTSEKAIFTSEGNHGTFRESKKIKFDCKKDVQFRISPNLLNEVVNRNNKCQVSENIIKISLDNFNYISCIWKAKEE